MYCENCGMKLEEGMRFCSGCGHKVSEMESPEIENKPEEKEAEILDAGIQEGSETVEEPESVLAPETVVEAGTVSEDVSESETVEKTEKMAEEIAEPADESENITESNSVLESDSVLELDQAANVGGNTRFCPYCGASNMAADAFCFSCGKSLDGADREDEKEKAAFTPGNKKILAGIGAAAAAIVLIVVCAAMFGGGKKGDRDVLLYLKDNEIVHYAKKEGIAIGDDLYDDKSDAGIYGSSAGYDITVSEDGKTLYYPQNFEMGSFDLYCKKLADTKSEGEKIVSGIIRYQVLKNGKVIYLEDGASQKLYITDRKEKSKIASDVIWFTVSEDEKNILWYASDDDSRMYVCDTEMKNDKIKIDSDVSDTIYVSDDLNTIVYLKEDVLYCVNHFDDKKKIASDVSDYVELRSRNSDKTEIYYVVEDDEGFSLSDFIEDDYAEQDAAMTEPDIADYQKVEVKQGYWGEREEIVTDDSYYDDMEKYEKKVERDYWREDLEEELELYSILYRYIPGEEKGEEHARGILEIVESYDEPVFLYQYLKTEGIEKMKLSALLGEGENDYYDMEDRLLQQLMECVAVYLVCDGNDIPLDVDFDEYEMEMEVCAVDEERKVCYLGLYRSDDYEQDLFKIDYKKADGTLELVAEEIGNVEYVTDDGVYYIAEAEDFEGELYLNDTRVDSDVKLYSVREMADGSGILYLTDPSDDKEEGTLKLFNGADSVTIADDVYQYRSGKLGEVVFLSDYNFNKYRGDLMRYKNKKTETIDSDVTAILYYK